MQDLSGRRIDTYSLISLLGQGAFGEVYLGKHIQNQSLVAVKILYTRSSEKQLRDFVNEARTFRLHHPNIISVLDFGMERASNLFFIVMDYASNGTLRQRHRQGSTVPLEIIVQYVRQITSALQYAHNENLVHRDLKPENLLIDKNGEILVSDFGIAMSVPLDPAHASATDIAGTSQYMAPEQIKGAPYAASDQYTLGVIVYEWLTGHLPFHGTRLEIVQQHLQTLPPPLPRDLPLLTPALEWALTRALAKDPGLRFASIHEFGEALERAYQDALSIQQDPATQAGLVQQWVDLGDRYRHEERYAEAERAFSQALALDPNCVDAYYKRGSTYSNLGDLQKGLDDCNRAIILDPQHIGPYNNRGSIYHKLKEYDKALADYSFTLHLDPKFASGYNNRGDVYRHLGHVQQALSDFSRAIELTSLPMAYCNRGALYNDQKDYQRALADLTSAIERSPRFARAYRVRGNVYLELKQYRQALDDFTHAVGLRQS
jgi:serine/threonine protein kinase